MAVEVIAAAVGMALVAVGIWFYVGNGWSVFRTDFFLTYLFMAIPMGLGFIAMALARSRIRKPVRRRHVFGYVVTVILAAIGFVGGLIVHSIVAAAIVAIEWCRDRPSTRAIGSRTLGMTS